MESQEVYLQALQPVSAATTTGSDIALGDPSVDALLTIIRVANLQDFMAAMKVDAEGSRQEPGCLRFDCLRVQRTTTNSVRPTLVLVIM